MEHHPSHDQTKILSMNIGCCERCPKILKKKLLKMPGVEAITIDTEKNLVLVTGPIDAMTLFNDVAKLGKRVELLPNEKHPNYNMDHVEEKHKENGCCQDGQRNNRKKEDEAHRCEAYYEPQPRPPKVYEQYGPQNNSHKKKEEEHKCEAYEPPNVDARICRDYYCTSHPKMRKIVDRVPMDSSSSLFGGLPYAFYNNNSFGRGGNPFSNYFNSGWYGMEDPSASFRYDHHQYQQPGMFPHGPFGFR